MIEDIAIYILIATLLVFIVFMPVVIIFNRKRKSHLRLLLEKCASSPLELKDFISNEMKSDSFLRRVINESLFSFRPYIDLFILSKLQNGIITSDDLAIYKLYDRKVNSVIKIFLSGLFLIIIIFIILGIIS